jgi:predicted short-subunit dehydrogenase-like oxidoreductase (DUF2520 family)
MRELEREQNTDTREAVALPPLAVIGPGRVGRSLVRAASDAGLAVSLSGRRDALAAGEQAEIALLCVPDAAIEDACDAIAAAVPPLRFVGHTSGATGLEAVSATSARGARAFSLHPLQTIPDGESVLAGIPCAVAGSDAEALRVATALAERLRLRPFALDDRDRAAYHAAASIASNYLVALEETAVELLERAGIEGGRELIAPLVLRTAANWAERGDAALTGPIARGDEETVARHVDAISEVAPELLDAYRALADRTRTIARPDAGFGPDASPKPEVAA